MANYSDALSSVLRTYYGAGANGSGTNTNTGGAGNSGSGNSGGLLGIQGEKTSTSFVGGNKSFGNISFGDNSAQGAIFRYVALGIAAFIALKYLKGRK